MKVYRKVIVLGLDGLEPKIVDKMMVRGALPHLARLAGSGGFGRIATTYPAQTPVAWSTFATGTNPGGHGIFDFLRRNPRTYLPDISLNRYEQKNAFTPPRAVNLRRGTPLWSLLSDAGIPSTVLRCPCTYPPDPVNGRFLAGMGVPDLRGGFGTSTFYTSAMDVARRESENVVVLSCDRPGPIQTQLIGPLQPRSREPYQVPITLETDGAANKIIVLSGGHPQSLEVHLGRWSDWLTVKIKTGLFQSIAGTVRFFLARLEPVIELYASPLNFDPARPLFPISHPADYSRELAQKIGTFHTTGMAEDHTGLNNERFDEWAFLAQCQDVWREREQMAFHELNRLKEGFFYCLFDTPDRIQHMFWRFQEEDHPAQRTHGNGNGRHQQLKNVIEDHYAQCDALVGKALEFADDQTLVTVLSDHGFGSFQRGVHLNGWLHQMGLLKLKEGVRPGTDTSEFFHQVDWTRSKAYALGLAGIYLNLSGREENGVVEPEEGIALKASIKDRLTGLKDDEKNAIAIRSVLPREQVYGGPYAAEAPDLIVNFAAGYRASWSTAMGGVAADLFEDNCKKWSGDHIVDPALVPGVLFMNRPFRTEGVRLLDMAPTILDAFGVAKGSAMEGASVLA